MSIQEASPTTPISQPKGQLILPTANRHTAALSGMIDSVLHKLNGFQSDRSLGCLSIGVVSSRSRVGVSTVAHRLAMQAALNGEGHVLIVDTNGIRPNQYKLSGVAKGPGLVDHIASGVDLGKCIQQSPVKHLDVLSWASTKTPGFTVPPAELKELFADLRSRYQYIFLDLPSMNEDTGAATLAFALMSDGVVIVLDGASSKESPTRDLVDLLGEHGIRVIGAIMNRYSPTLPRWLRRWF
jgi:Mrp family chromosome partitioning ATPase